MEQKSYDVVDLVKLGMAFLIVALHCGTGGLNVIGRLGVPFFFIASSYFFFQKYLYVNSTKQSTLLKRYVKRIFYLYLAWQIIYLPSTLYTVQEGFNALGGVRILSYPLGRYLFAIFYQGNMMAGDNLGIYL